jgi:hypothetical protein
MPNSCIDPATMIHIAGIFQKLACHAQLAITSSPTWKSPAHGAANLR